ncbi:MAG TPA: AAA family ATPase [Solirubrobacteraceae bacterium]|jgi:5-methylcytosine-specific restriction protein B|nr:AAA family ATPase [Solirubrobacteraceae bacterium]
MTRVAGSDALYAVADLLRSRCLERDDSLFTPGRMVWTAAAAEELAVAVAEDDTSNRDFADKLADHLRPLSPESQQLAAEILYLVLLPESNTTSERKMEHVGRVLSLLPSEVSLPEDLLAPLSQGFSTFGQGTRAHRHEFIRYLARFARDWKHLPHEEQAHMLEDPWAFQRFVDGVESERADTERSALLHLVFPDTFESIVSKGVKERIAAAYSDRVTDLGASLDMRLADIRTTLEAEHGKDFDYWDPPIKATWDLNDSTAEVPDPGVPRRPGQEAVEAAIRSLATTRLRTQTDSMLRIFLAFKAIHRGGEISPVTGHHIEEVVEELFRLIPTPPETPDSMIKGTIALRGKNGAPIWLSNDSHRGSFMDYAGPTSPGRFLFADEDWRLAMREDALDRVVETLGTGQYGWPSAQALSAIALRGELLDPDLDWPTLEDLARSRFGVGEQEWAAVTSTQPLGVDPLMGPEWDPAQLSNELRPPGLQDAEKAEKELEELPSRLAADVKRVLEALDSHGDSAIIALVGVPGTSKSHVARLAARAFASEGCLREIQFSPSYTYEEFMEGPRYGGEMKVEVVPGAFLELNRRALGESANQYVMLIEELTRADLSRVLGELLTFIEYRDESDLFATLYTREDVTRIAPNLAVLATYNPTDRSAISVDAALIRRMRILDFPPDMELLREITAENGLDTQVIDSLVAMFDACREVAGERFDETMPFGHALFVSVTSEADLHHLWHQTIKHILIRPHTPRHELYPTIAQHYPWRESASHTVVPFPEAAQEAESAPPLVEVPQAEIEGPNEEEGV